MGYSVFREALEEPPEGRGETVFPKACPCAHETVKMQDVDSGTRGNNRCFRLMKNVN